MAQLSHQSATHLHLKSARTHLAIWAILNCIAAFLLTSLSIYMVIIFFLASQPAPDNLMQLFLAPICLSTICIIFYTITIWIFATRTFALRAQFVTNPAIALQKALKFNKKCITIASLPAAFFGYILILLLNISGALNPSLLLITLLLLSFPLAVLFTRRTLRRALAAHPHLAPPSP